MLSTKKTRLVQKPHQKQTIFMIASTSFFSDYGCHVRIYEEIRSLQELGHRVVLATYHNGNDVPGIEIHRSWDIPWVKRTMVGSSRHKLYLDVGLSWRSLRVARTLQPTIIHAHTHEAGLIGVVLKWLLHKPLILDYQGSMTSEMLDHGFISRNSLFYPALKNIEQRVNRWADAVVTSTHNAATILQQDQAVDENRLYTMVDSVDTQRFRPFDGSPFWEAHRQELRAQLGIPEGRRVVVYLGLLAPYQGTNILIQAAQKLVSRMPDVHFLIMGYPDPSSYAAYADSLGIANHVTLPGRILYKDAHDYLALGDVAVAPKMSQTEGSGKLMNYLSMGLSIVTFDTPVSREILGDIGLYARLGSAEDLAKKLALALEDRELAAQLGAAGRTRAIEEFSWDQAALQLESIYEKVAQRSTVSASPRHNNTKDPLEVA
jgi:glycosyltransferase involved in cell wall biosynthesis